MSYLTKKEALNGIRIRTRIRNGVKSTAYDAYLGYDPFSGRQKRMQSNDLASLKAEIDRFYALHKVGGDASVRLKAHEAVDAREALDLLSQHGKVISLTEVVQRWLGETDATPVRSKTLGEAYDEFLASLVGKSADYLKALRYRIGKFICELGRDTPLASITAQAVVKDLKDRLLDKGDEKTWKTYNNHLGDIKTFFGWCAKPEQGFITASPVAEVKKIVLHYHDPEYAKADDIGKLFAVLVKHADESPADLADAILSFFCGLRQCEIDRVRDGEAAVKVALDAPEPFIRVVRQKGATSGKRPRAFRISEQAISWMRSFDFTAAIRIPNNRFRRHLVERAREAGVDLPKNAGRHTFITMYAAAYHDQAKLTSIVGNTEGVRANSYDGVEVEANGRAYFAITPESIEQKP